MSLSALRTFVARQRTSATWVLLAASTLWLAFAASDFIRTRGANHNIRELVAKHDIAIDLRHATSQEILARVDESVRRDHIEDAQSILSSVEANLAESVRAEALYNIANARTRLAAESVRTGDIDTATALVNLAKSEYRLALKLDPENWDIRYNLDVAMRVVRDFPPADNPDINAPTAPKNLWTDLPGIPKGLP
jgi:mxaK protein